MRYYYLLAGLQELEREGKALPLDDLLEQMREQMPASDWKLVELLRTKADDDESARALYTRGQKCKNRFIRDWYAMNRDMNNVLVANICRKHGLDTQKSLVGELPEELSPEFEALVRIDNFYEREKAQDALRWQWLDDHTLFCNFEIENVLAYYLKVEMLTRWSLLTVEQGEKVFRNLVADFKKGIKLDE